MLLFGSNPILFVGYGLGDEDLLHPLRLLGALEMEEKPARPLFALIHERAEGADWDLHQQYYERYGVNVIPYSGGDARSGGRGHALCTALAGLKRESTDWREGWLMKPAIRKVSVVAQPEHPYRHYGVVPERDDYLGPARVRAQIDDLIEAAHSGARVLGLVGPGGTGKSWHALRLMEELVARPGEFKSFFFWSSYYADDALTGLDRLLAYLDSEGKAGKNRIERFTRSLESGRHLIIFDGFERLLRETGIPEEGKAYTSTVSRFLDLVGHLSHRSTVILTSRLWPVELGAPGPGKGAPIRALPARAHDHRGHMRHSPLLTAGALPGVGPLRPARGPRLRALPGPRLPRPEGRRRGE